MDAALRRKGKTCNCKNSRCLKLYCECFASGSYCEPGVCNCTNCFNNRDNEQQRAEAVEATLERNPSAFRPKIAPAGPASVAVRHHKGCNCKKSGCLKKYCECFQAGIMCSDVCKCVDCRNYEGCPDLHVAIATSRGGLPPAMKKRAKVEPPVAPQPTGFLSRASARAVTAAPVHSTRSSAPEPQLRSRRERDLAPIVVPPPQAVLRQAAQPPSIPAPQAVPVLEFSVVSEEYMRNECAKLLATFSAAPIHDAAMAVSPEAERGVLVSLLGSLRSLAGRIAFKNQA